MKFPTCIWAISVAMVTTVFSASAATPGAIFTTVSDGSEVNYNIYPSKDAVYLDGGPGPGAPQTAAGLSDGRYVFQVTDPPGKTLLSTDDHLCRLFDVSNGIISNYVAKAQNSGCPTADHNVGLDLDHGAVTIQLMPYNDTPNNGGEYKVWATLLSDYKTTARGNKFGFVASNSKTDNFKVASPISPELDSRFFRSDGSIIDGLTITHVDPLGASNAKWSYLNTALDINHEAHVEAVETGFHLIQIADQPGCTVGLVKLAGAVQGVGPMTVTVHVTNNTPITTFIDISCQ
jgi:hypothetical protein